MVKKNGFNKAANAAIISGTLLIILSLFAFFYGNGASIFSQLVMEYRSEVFGVAVGILVFGIVGKFLGVKLG